MGWDSVVRRYSHHSDGPNVRLRAEMKRPSQEKVLAFIQERGEMPTCQEVADYMGWKHAASAYDCLRKLSSRNLIGRRVGKDGRLEFFYPN